MSNKWFSFIYDKSFNNNHGYNIKETEDLTEDTIDDSFTQYETNDSILKFNKTMVQKNFKIPELNKSFYKVKYFEKNENNNTISITIIKINIKLLKEFISKKSFEEEYNKLCDNYSFNFLKKVCKFHYHYTKKKRSQLYNSELSKEFEKYEKTIMEPVRYFPEDGINKPVDEDDNYDLLTVDLYDYQKCSIGWMVDRERQINSLYYNVNNEIIIDDMYFDLELNDFFFSSDKNKIKFYGGGLIDEVGLGKTIQSATLCLLNQPKNISYIRENSEKFHSRATLVICPNTLCGQWKRELQNKISKSYNVNVITMVTKRDYDKYTYEDLCNADFVIASFNYLFNPSVVAKWLTPISRRKNYLDSYEFNREKVLEEIKIQGVEMLKNPLNNLLKINTNLAQIKWHRIMIDEFHELYSNTKYKGAYNLLPIFKSDYRWIITGTPFISNISYIEMLDFLSNYKINNLKDVLKIDSINNYVEKNLFRRNTKESVKDEYKLPPIEEEILLLKFTKTERMMYNAYLADGNNDKFSTYLRQLCCHPNLADETKKALANCKTLKDVEKTMVEHYKNQAFKAKVKLIKINKRLDSNVRNINNFITKQQAKVVIDSMRKNKYDVERIETDDKDAISELIQIEKDDNDDDIGDINEHSEEHEDASLKKLLEQYSNIDLEDGMENNEAVKSKSSNDFSSVADYIIDNYEIKKNNKKLKESKQSEFINTYVAKCVDKTVNLDFNTLTNLKLNYSDIIKIRDNICKEIKGKLSSYRFFSNVVSRIKNTVKEELSEKKFESKPFSLTLDSDSEDESDDEEEDETCGICMCEVEGDEVGVTKCGHIFCYSCIKSWVEKKYNCSTCKQRLNIKDVYLVSYEKKQPVKQNEKDLSKQELINNVGTKLANLIEYLKENNDHTIIFSQWDDLLKKVGEVLNQYGIKNVFCKGSVFQRDKAVREFNTDDKIKVIMLSSQSAASGTNLTKAKQIVLLDPVYGTYEYRRDTENQAIGRSHRLGQKNKLKVVRLIIKDSVEQEIYDMNKEEDKKHISERVIKEISIED